MIGKILPSIPAFLDTLTVVGISIPIALFGTTSPAELATTVGVLTEVTVMLTLVKIANGTKKMVQIEGELRHE